MSEKPREKPPRSRRARILAVLISTALSLVAAEGVSRLVMPIPLHPTDTYLVPSDPAVMEADSAPLWLRSDISVEHTEEDFSVTVTTNARGLRDDDCPYEKPDGERRLLSLGDSFAFGYGVELQETYCKVAARELGPEWRAINAGVPSWGTADELDFLVSEGFRYDPDIVVLCFFNNDLRDNWVRQRYTLTPDGGVERVRPIDEDRLQRTEFGDLPIRNPLLPEICERGAPAAPLVEARRERPKAGWLVAHSNLYRLARRAASRTAQRERDDNESQPMQRRYEEHVRIASALLAEVTRQCAERELPLVIALMPSKERVDGAGRAQYERVQEAAVRAGELGAHVLDLLPALSAESATRERGGSPDSGRGTGYGGSGVGRVGDGDVPTRGRVAAPLLRPLVAPASAGIRAKPGGMWRDAHCRLKPALPGKAPYAACASSGSARSTERGTLTMAAKMAINTATPPAARKTDS